MKDWIETLTDEERETLGEINEILTHAVNILGIVNFQEALDYAREGGVELKAYLNGKIAILSYLVASTHDLIKTDEDQLTRIIDGHLQEILHHLKRIEELLDDDLL